MTRTYPKQNGFTMVELLVILVIAAILAVIAAPSFSSFVNNTRMASTMSQLTGDLNFARGEAIKRNMRVLVCVRNAAGTGCGAGTDRQNAFRPSNPATYRITLSLLPDAD